MLLLAVINLTASAQVYLDSLYKQANSMLSAFKAGDHKTLLHYTHPNLIEYMGGSVKALEILRMATETLETRKVNIKKAEMGKITQNVLYNKTIQCVIPQIMEMQVGETNAKSISYIFCISYNEGKEWYFINADKEKEKSLRNLIPGISDKIIIPESEVTYN